MTWRPLPDPDDPARGPRALRDSLDRVSRSLGGPGAEVLAAVFDRWPAIVGPSIAAHSWPLSVANGLLTIAVDQPGWATQLSFLEDDLCRRVSEVAGDGGVDRVRVVVRAR